MRNTDKKRIRHMGRTALIVLKAFMVTLIMTVSAIVMVLSLILHTSQILNAIAAAVFICGGYYISMHKDD